MRLQVHRLSEFTVIAGCTLLLAVGAASALSSSQAPAAAPQAGVRVSGTLVGPEGQSKAGREVLLVPVRLIDLEGKEVKRLPPKGTVIIDRSDATAVTKAQASGVFEFTKVVPGRYSICVKSAPDGTPRGGGLIHLEREGSTVFFDVAAADVDVGSVSEKPKQP